jgi:hypothetical protein
MLPGTITMKPEDYIKREQEIQEAVKAYPGREMGEAYRLWKAIRGEKATMLVTGDKEVEAVKKVLKQSAKKPCTQPGCDGEMVLESVCGGCVEGRAGYKSKWTCDKCLFRELSKKDFLQWLKELSSSTP